MFDSHGGPRYAMVMALLRLSWRRFGHTLGWRTKVLSGMRQPTRGKFKMGSWLGILLMLMLLGQTFFATRSMIATHAEPILEKSSGKISVSRSLFMHMQSYDGSYDFSRSHLEFFIENEAERRNLSIPAKEAMALFEKKGIGAFQVEDPFVFREIDLSHVSASERAGFDRVMGMIFVAVLIALFCMPFAMREKDLAATNGHLEWLFSLPLRGSEILLGRFLATSLIRPLLLMILWPLLTHFCNIAGHAFPVAAMLGLALGLLVSVALAGMELVIDTWLRSRASVSTVQNVQMFMMIVGQLAFYTALAASIASKASLPWVTWLASRLPGYVCQPMGGLLMSATLFFFAVMLVAAIVFGLGGFALSAYLLRAGLLSGRGRTTRARSIVGEKIGNRSHLAFEWLLLKRDRTLATQVIALPLLMIAYQLLINPDLLSHASAGGIAVGIYTCGAFSCLTTAPNLLYSEMKGAWLIYNLPILVSAYFQNREKLWRGISTMLAAILTLVAILLTKSFSLADLWRYGAALVGVWIMGRVVTGIVLGQPKLPDSYSGERPKLSFGRTYGAMLVAGIYGGQLYRGDPWHLFCSLVMFGFLGTAIWQRRRMSFRHLLEPTHKEAPSWGVDDALWSVFVFLSSQYLSMLILYANDVAAGNAVFIAFLIGGGIASGYTLLRRQSKGLPLPPIREITNTHISPKRVFMETCAASLVCIAAGVAWLYILKYVWLMDSKVWQEAQETLDQPFFLLIAVVAAPLIEEPLFRGFVLRTMTGFWRMVPSVVSSALLFAIIHPGISFPPVFLLGIATAILYLRSRSLLPSIILHAVYNLAIILLAKWV